MIKNTSGGESQMRKMKLLLALIAANQVFTQALT